MTITNRGDLNEEIKQQSIPGPGAYNYTLP